MWRCSSPAKPSRVRMLTTSKTAIRALCWSVLAAAYIGALLTQPPEVYDEGLIVAGAMRILHGQLPYRDFNTGYPPGQFYTIAGVFSVFGTTLLAERVWDTVWRLAIVALAIVLARAATPWHRPHPLPLICAGLVTGSIDAHLYPMISGMLPCFAAVCCPIFEPARGAVAVHLRDGGGRCSIVSARSGRLACAVL